MSKVVGVVIRRFQINRRVIGPVPLKDRDVARFRYGRETLVARGGEGEVFRQKQAGYTMAVKRPRGDVPPQSIGGCMVDLSDYYVRRDGQVLVEVSHPNIVTCYAVWEQNGKMHVIQEYVGPNLFKQVERWGKGSKLPLPQALFIVREVALALEYIHNRRMAHADIKPENILIDHLFERDEWPVVKVIDFALSRRPGQRLSVESDTRMYGTPNYMDEDRLFYEAPEKKHDVYALGIILFELLTGQAVVEGSRPSPAKALLSIRELKAKIQKAELPGEAIRGLILRMTRRLGIIPDGPSLVRYIDENIGDLLQNTRGLSASLNRYFREVRP